MSSRRDLAKGLPCLLLVALLGWPGSQLAAQTGETSQSAGQESASKTSSKTLGEQAGEISESVSGAVADVAETIDESQEARQAADSILNPIYQFAEQLAFPSFYWIAFAMMATGVVSFALQLVLGKLLLLARMHLNLAEVLSDLLGLCISAVGLVLTTQAATENSTFTQSSAMVLSAAVTGAVLGFLFFVWGFRLESRSARAKDARKSRR